MTLEQKKERQIKFYLGAILYATDKTKMHKRAVREIFRNEKDFVLIPRANVDRILAKALQPPVVFKTVELRPFEPGMIYIAEDLPLPPVRVEYSREAMLRELQRPEKPSKRELACPINEGEK